MKRIISVALAIIIGFGPEVSYAQGFVLSSLPQPGDMVQVSTVFQPALIKGMVIDPAQPLQFKFVVDSGNDESSDALIKEEGERMVKYFLAAVTVPQQDLWVNLSPYEKDRMITNELGNTELGRDMLAQDYVLKQLTASAMDPNKDLGKEFWSRIYSEAAAKFGTTDIPVDAFNKVWIMPSEAEVFERGNAVYVTKAHLKIMLDSDHQAVAHTGDAPQRADTQSFSTHDASAQELTKDIMRSIIIPTLEKEINEGKNFTTMRQIYHAAILAKWYREIIKNTLMEKAYVGQKKIKGVDVDDATIKEQIYQRYVAAFKQGVINMIAEAQDPVTGETIQRKIFSGGERFDDVAIDLKKTADAARVGNPVGQVVAMSVTLGTSEAVENSTSNIKAKFDTAMAGDADGVVTALYDRLPKERQVTLDRLNPERVIQIRQQIAEAASKLQSMISFKGAEGDVPSVDEIIEKLVDTNVFSPVVFDKDLMTRLGVAQVPPTFTFDGSLFTTYRGQKKPQVMALTLGEDYFAVTATSVNLPNYKKYGVWKTKGLLSSGFDLKRFLLSKGGVRIYQLGKGVKDLKGTLENKLKGEGSKPLAVEVADLAIGMSGKVPAEVLFEGGKTTIIMEEGVDPSKVIRSWTRSSILAGVLGRLYDAGPDMGSATLMGDLQEEANKVHGVLGLPQVPVTTSIEGEIASFDHFKWTVTSISAFESFMVVFQDPWIRTTYGMKDKVDLVIQGYGDVGSGLVKYISSKYEHLLKDGTLRFVAAADITGGIYDPQGLDVNELLRLRDMDPKQLSLRRDYVAPSGHRVETFEKGTDVFFMREKGADPERSGVAFPAAGPGVFQTRADVERLKAAGIDVLVSPANNVLKENIGLEDVLEEVKVLYLSGSSVSHGGIQTSTEEIFHIMYEGLDVLRQKVAADEDGWKAHIQDGIIGLTQSLITWELDKFKTAIKKGSKVTFQGIHMDLVKQIQAQKDLFLSLPPTPIFEMVDEEVRAVWAKYEENGNLLTTDQRDAIALVIILNRIVEESQKLAMYSSKDRNDIIKKRQTTLEKMLETPAEVPLVDQKIATYELGRFAAYEAKEELKRVIIDPRFDPVVRGFSAEAFVVIGEPKDIPFLQEVAQKAKDAKMWSVSFAANLAIERITAKEKLHTLEQEKPLSHDASMNNKALVKLKNVGGIDIQNINVLRQNDGAMIGFDSATLQSIIDRGHFEGLTPVVTGIVRMDSPLVALGIK